MKTVKARELKEFFNRLMTSDLNSPVYIEDESTKRYAITDFCLVENKFTGEKKILLEFDHEEQQ